MWKLTAEDGEAHDLFGLSVAISGDMIVVGACGDDDAGSASGSAYVFDVVTGEQIWKLTAQDAGAGDSFGFLVSVSDELAIIGAPRDEDAGEDSGAAYLFDLTTGQQLGKLTATDAAIGDEFGFAVSVSGGVAVSGAWKDDDMGDLSGSAYVFSASSCPADFDGDGDVDTADLLFLLGAWGTPDGDVDGDGDTDTADLLALLAAWGECP